MGAWTALRGQRAGWPTTLIDAYGAGHPRATSGDETRIIRASHGADPLYATLVPRGARGLARLRRGGRRGLPPPGRGALVRPPRGRVRGGVVATLHRAGHPRRAPRRRPRSPSAGRRCATDDLAFAAYEPEAGLLLARTRASPRSRAGSRASAARFELAWAEPGAADGRAPARRRRRRRPAVRGGPVRLRRRAVAAAPLPGRARRPHPGDEAGRRLRRPARGRRPVRAGRTARAGSTTTPRSTASRRSTGAA